MDRNGIHPSCNQYALVSRLQPVLSCVDTGPPKGGTPTCAGVPASAGRAQQRGLESCSQQHPGHRNHADSGRPVSDSEIQTHSGISLWRRDNGAMGSCRQSLDDSTVAVDPSGRSTVGGRQNGSPTSDRDELGTDKVMVDHAGVIVPTTIGHGDNNIGYRIIVE